MTSKQCGKCSSLFLPSSPNQKYCCPECSNFVRSKREKTYRKTRKDEGVNKGSHPLQKQKPTQKSNLKNLQHSIKETCDLTERGKVTVIDISKDLPATLSNWEPFVCAYYSRVGTVIKFVKIDAHHWAILNESERERWTVGQWTQWFGSTKDLDEKTEAFYLVDIPVQEVHIQKLRENALIDAFSYGGKFCLTQYIKKYWEDIPTPDLKYKAFIAPPWGNIMTFPHKDGFGTQLSLHCCIIGSGYNLVHYWPKLNPNQDMLFRQVTNLPPTGTKQKAPHQLDFSVDDSSEVWDAELERKLLDEGVSSSAIKVSPGQAIILPPDQYHCFKKVFQIQDGSGIPLVGLACDSTYIGATEESFNSYYQSIKATQRSHNWASHIFCILELSLYCLFQLLVSSPSLLSDEVFRAHIKGAFPRFVAWVQSQSEDAKRAAQHTKLKEDHIITIEDYKESFCHQCKFPLVNLFAVLITTLGSENICINCLLHPAKKDDGNKISDNSEKRIPLEYQLKCRIASPFALHYLLTNVKKIIGEGPNPLDISSEEITHDFVSGIITRDHESIELPAASSRGTKDGKDDNQDMQLLHDNSDEQLEEELNTEDKRGGRQNLVSNTESKGQLETIRKPFKVNAKQKMSKVDHNALEETPKPLSLFGVPLRKRKYGAEEGSTEPVKKKMKVDNLPSSSALHSRLSDKIINDYLDLRKTSPKFNSSYVFSTFFFEGFEDGDRGARWKLPDLFKYQLLIIPIFQRQREHWRLAILTKPQNLLVNNKKTINSSTLFIFDSFYDTSNIATDIKKTVLRILWNNHLKFNPSTELSKLDDKNLVFNPMKTCRQSNDVDCGVYILHFIDEFVGFGGSDKEQVDRDIWKKPFNVDQKRKEIEETLKQSNLTSSECLVPTAATVVSSYETSYDPLFDPNNPRFKFNVYPPDKPDLTDLQKPKGLVSAPILDQYLSFVLEYDKSQFCIIPAHYSDMVANCDTDIIADFPNLLNSKYILLPVHNNTHWVLLIIVNASCLLQSQCAREPRCNVFLLDSYQKYGLKEDFFFDLARRLLKAAVKINTKTNLFDKKKIVFESLPVVQQTNGYDCGLFLLHNVETFVKSPFSSTEQFGMNQLWKKSFKPMVKRRQLFDKLSSSPNEK